MTILEDQAALLDATTWARGLGWLQVKALVPYMELRVCEAGEVLVREGDRDAFLGVIAEGEVAVTKRDARRVERPVARLGAGRCFGEMSLLDGEPRSATVTATSRTVVLTLAEASLERLFEEKPRLGVEVLRRLGRMASRNLRRTSGRLVDVLSETVA